VAERVVAHYERLFARKSRGRLDRRPPIPVGGGGDPPPPPQTPTAPQERLCRTCW
jgi:hypothetical protein